MTAAEKVRLLIADTSAPYHYTDDQIDAFLDMADDDIYIAAALALEAWAASLSEDAESEKIGDYSYSKKAANNKLALAARYRNQSDGPAMDWAELNFEATRDDEEVE